MPRQFSGNGVWQPLNQVVKGLDPKSLKRASRACQRCHEKKIKCNLQSGNDSSTKCQNCIAAGSFCQIRPSNRGRKKAALPPPNILRPVPGDNQSSAGQILERTTTAGSASAQTDGYSNAGVEASHFPGMTHNGSTDQAIDERPMPLLGTSSISRPSHDLLDNSPGSSLSVAQSAIPLSHLQDISPSQGRSETQQYPNYIRDTGGLQLFTVDVAQVEGPIAEPLLSDRTSPLDDISHDLLQSYLETYFEQVGLWCPVLDPASLKQRPTLLDSLMFRHALALCGTRLRPPLVTHTPAIEHYKRAKGLFYAGYPDNVVAQISAIMLFYWYSPGPPNVASLDTNWWWIHISARLAQNIGLHREPNPDLYTPETIALRRRIWWTLFVRDRMAALAHGKPAVIDSDDCDVRMVTVEDISYLPHIQRAIFVNWVKLWEIAGRIFKGLSRHGAPQVAHSLTTLDNELIAWAQSLPDLIQLPFGDQEILRYNRDVYLLHLHYLTVVILAHITKEPDKVPKASLPAIAAASCMARICREYLTRASLRFMGCEAVWFIAVGAVTMIYARMVEGLTHHAEADLDTLRLSLRELSPLWYSGRMFERGIDNLLKRQPQTRIASPAGSFGNANDPLTGDGEFCSSDCAGSGRWKDHFPYLTAQTTPLIATLMVHDSMRVPLPDLDWPFEFFESGNLFEAIDGTNFNYL